jgi:CheY-like chemotaxis protein
MVLKVEDNVDVREVLEYQLTGAGYEVLEATEYKH